ncbi:Outer membrane protein transport protein (OMPP1/FadL/TodX) [Planctomycetes bacterium CA13]|uniref:Outer membrane protein transport protein (OMPP1/FadL/TodX) n=1 Tax=Novipirellula herctigrandis TaxID=2527986 RepID=A0A5C5Z8J5_9BACT|nr:Outer membrane protein transport protein (OMPP1/FadL/TodX) [Planctomycetes bacterium CA13]
MISKSICSHVALLLVLVAAIPASAAGTISNALSARSAGRGGTNLAFGDNGVILMDNTAGMQSLLGYGSNDDTYLDVGGVGLFTDMNYQDADNSKTHAYDNPAGLGHLMIGRRINDDIVFGFGAFAPAGFASDYDLQGPPATLPGEHHYFSFGALVRILPGLSLRLTDRLTVGGTFGLAASHLEIEGPYYLNSMPLRGTPTMLDLQSTGSALSWSCGMQYAVSDQTTIGVRYQSQNEFTSNGKANVAIAGLGDSDYDVNVGLAWARSVGIGMMHQVDARQRVAIDFIWEDWSDAYDNASLTFTNPSNPVFEAVAGPSIDEVFPLLWEDSLVVSAGYERDFGSNQTVRLGYRYQDNPVPPSTASTYLQTTLEHHFSAGYGFKHSGWEIDTAYQFAFAPNVYTATSVYPGGDFSDAILKTQTHMVFLSAMRRF